MGSLAWTQQEALLYDAALIVMCALERSWLLEASSDDTVPALTNSLRTQRISSPGLHLRLKGQ